ncbi:MAG: ATP-dependent helicase Lhr and Lhr-like helicase [Actinomycetota bacterium]|nr:ATP-dependent helicase Lhr and Lhr-like helicase [Actinomycetota bacterium]
MSATGLTPALDYHVVNSLGWPDLRPLQRAAVEPVRSGADVLLLAPTAGGKTEAAVFPLLSAMVDTSWTGLSVLYLTPLKALLNNLEPRLATYTGWLGRRVGLWHGDIGPAARRTIITDPPDILLTTPESLEAMLVSVNVDHRALFAGVRAVVVDELHAFAGDDRGWHLLAVLERVSRLAGRRLQRVGLSATIGNPDALLTWLGGGTPAQRAQVVAPQARTVAPADAEVTLDYVGTVANAATVIAALHRGEKRLVFCDSRAQAETLALELRAREITTFVSHSSLAAEERRRSEQAFAEARDCVVVATSTLELGIDVGDLDRVIQLDAPRTVASFLQRLGRTGRRPGSSRNTIFLATRHDAFLQAAGLLRLWRSGFIEPVVPPPNPRHITAQQLLALALQQGSFGRRSWSRWWAGLPVMDSAEEVLDYLVAQGFLEADGDLLFMGPTAETRFGRRHFMDLTAVFTADPELTVLHGRTEVGSVSPVSLTEHLPEGRPRVLALAGRAWVVTHVDWRRRTVSVAASDSPGRSRWGHGGMHLGRDMAQSMRAVLLGEDPGVPLSRRGVVALEKLRAERRSTVAADGSVLARDAKSARWWTYAGGKANTSLAAVLTAAGYEVTADSFAIGIAGPVDAAEMRATSLTHAHAVPAISPEVLEGLKFSAALPVDVATEVLAQRMTDPGTAGDVAQAPMTVVEG